jgi:hypothetical protein
VFDTVAAGAIDDPAAFASVDEATKPIDASDNVSASNFFIFPFLSLCKKNRPSANPVASVTLERESLV